MIALIAAYARNRVIGLNGKIPWKIEGEQGRFRELTTGNVVIMGRRTFEEIGRPLPDRTTIVVSNTKTFTGKDCYTAHSLTEAIKLAGKRDIFISGGESLYRESLVFVEKMYLTEIDFTPSGDTFFPAFDESQFTKEVVSSHKGEIPYTYVTYTRKETV